MLEINCEPLHLGDTVYKYTALLSPSPDFSENLYVVGGASLQDVLGTQAPSGLITRYKHQRCISKAAFNRASP